jgi:hypothetical protein
MYISFVTKNLNSHKNCLLVVNLHDSGFFLSNSRKTGKNATSEMVPMAINVVLLLLEISINKLHTMFFSKPNGATNFLYAVGNYLLNSQIINKVSLGYFKELS